MDFRILKSNISYFLLKKIVSLAIIFNVIFLQLPFSSASSGTTTEMKINIGEDFLSFKPNTLSISKEGISINWGDGSNETLYKNDSKTNPYYLTIIHSNTSDNFYIYNYDKKIVSLNLGNRPLNIRDLINDLKERYENKEISFFKSTNYLLSRERIQRTERDRTISSTPFIYLNASIGAVSSIILLVACSTPPPISKVLPPTIKTAPQPAGPGLPFAAPSV